MRLLVEGTGYVDAVDAFLHANHAAALRHDALTGELAAYGAMAGDAATSADFAATYDAAAADAVGALADVVAAFTTLGRLTCASLANHSSAEGRSVLPGAAVFTGEPLPDGLHASVLPARLPTALGGDPSSLPGELGWLLDQVEGFVWPDADVDRLRAAADTWRRHGSALGALVDHCGLSIAALHREHSPEIPIAVSAVRDLETTLGDLAEQYAAIAGACEDYADQVEAQREALLGLLWDLLRDSAIIQGAGIGLSFVTGGATGLGATAVNAGRIAAHTPRILAFVAAEAAAAVVRVAGAGLARVRRVLGRFVGVPVGRFIGTRAVRQSPDDVLASLRRGRSAPHRQVDSVAELRRVFRELTRDGSPMGAGSYPGQRLLLEDGTTVGLRETSRSGGATIDIVRPNGQTVKVHLP